MPFNFSNPEASRRGSRSSRQFFQKSRSKMALTTSSWLRDRQWVTSTSLHHSQRDRATSAKDCTAIPQADLQRRNMGFPTPEKAQGSSKARDLALEARILKVRPLLTSLPKVRRMDWIPPSSKEPYFPAWGCSTLPPLISDESAISARMALSWNR
jgi:hypothetical protein